MVRLKPPTPPVSRPTRILGKEARRRAAAAGMLRKPGADAHQPGEEPPRFHPGRMHVKADGSVATVDETSQGATRLAGRVPGLSEVVARAQPGGTSSVRLETDPETGARQYVTADGQPLSELHRPAPVMERRAFEPPVRRASESLPAYESRVKEALREHVVAKAIDTQLAVDHNGHGLLPDPDAETEVLTEEQLAQLEAEEAGDDLDVDDIDENEPEPESPDPFAPMELNPGDLAEHLRQSGLL